jgi:KDO2-lipid IV(A) lauroyltransferase
MSDSVRNTIKVQLLRLFFLSLSRLPFSWLRGLGYLAGTLTYYLNGRGVKVSRRNLELCFPQLSASEIESLTRRSCVHSAQCALESIWVWFNPPEKVTRRFVAVEGLKYLQQAKDQGQAVVMTGAHLGNWEALLNWVARTTTCAIAYKQPKNAEMEPVIRKAREKAGVEMVPGTREGVKTMFNVLERGDTFIILSDQKPGKKSGVFAPFFNRPAYTMTIVQKLVQKTNAQLLYFYARRVKEGFLVHIEPATFDLNEPDPVAFATALNRGLVEQISQCPEQFEWSYRRFRPQPEGEPAVYENL